jgi:uncharacterized protein
MLVKPQEGGNEEEICHDPRHRIAEADTRPRQGRHQPETHTASRNHFHHATQHREIAVTQPLDTVSQDGEQTQTRIEIVAMHQGESAPVGKVDIIRLYPMSFEEFLMAKDEEQLLNILKSKDWKTITLLHDKLIKILREYYFVGGMPEAVKTYLATNDANLVRQVQNNILTIYRSDMSKHVSPNEATRISMVWQSIPSQLAKENKKFIYGAVRSGARAKDFEMAIQWLVDAGLTYRISRVREVGMPLKFYEDLNAFKLFLLDVGLLGALSEMEPAQMLISNKAMTESKGAFTENYVLTQLLCQQDIYTYYYSREDARLEIDFLAQHQGVITPIEVKAEENLRSKSLRAFFDAHPDLRAIRFSMSPYKEQEWMKNVPLYGVEESF